MRYCVVTGYRREQVYGEIISTGQCQTRGKENLGSLAGVVLLCLKMEGKKGGTATVQDLGP